MKRQIQKTGVRKFFGQDFIDLQAEPLKALDAFFAEYGACLIEGCAVTEADGGRFSVAPGLVALESTDPDSGAVAIRTMPFAGAEGVALPLYLVAEWVVVERAYGDGKVKPIGYNLWAVASGVVPEGPHLVLTDAGGNRFVDAVQDGTHRFITDAERSKWNDVLRQAKEYAQTQAASSQATAVGLAKAHTDGQVAAVRDELAVGDQAALRSAKEYADRIVAALVDNSPELLNTLEELAGALGNDPNFATTVMDEIGKRVKGSEAVCYRNVVANADDAKATGYYFCTQPDTYGTLLVVAAYQNAQHPMQLFATFGGESEIKIRTYNSNTSKWGRWAVVYTSLNLPGATHSEMGLMSAADKTKLDSMVAVSADEKTNWSAKVDPSNALVYRGVNVGASPNDCKDPGYYFDTRTPVAGSLLVVRAHNNAYHPFQLLLPHALGGLWTRAFNSDNGTWSPWRETYDSGNLKIIRGSVNANGYGGGGSGFIASPSGNLVRINHDLGTGYCFTHTLHQSTEQGLQMHIIERGNNYILVGVWGLGSNYLKVGFDFMLMPW